MRDEDRTPEERAALAELLSEFRSYDATALVRIAFDRLRAERDADVAERERLRAALEETANTFAVPIIEVRAKARAALKEPHE